MYVSKKVCGVYNEVWGEALESVGIFENYCVKSNLTVMVSNITVCKATFNCK